MALKGEDDAVNDLLNIKIKLEQNITHLRQELEAAKQKLGSLRENKEKTRKNKAFEFQQLFNLRMSLADVEKQLEASLDQVRTGDKNLKELEVLSQDQMKITGFERSILTIKDSIEGAINFYTEDSLQIEFMKRQKEVRDRRVEYTKLETEYQELARRVEEQKLEKERARLAEEERVRLEQERMERLEQERAQEELERQKDKFRLQMQASVDSPVLPFLGNPQPETGAGTKCSVKFLEPDEKQEDRTNGTSAASHNKTAVSDQSTGHKTSSFSCDSFSQLLNW